MRTAFAVVCVCLAAGASGSAAARAPYPGIDMLEPPASSGAWDGDRMRGARERLNDILPGNPS